MQNETMKTETEKMFILSARDIDWLCQDASRQVQTLELFLQKMSPQERRLALTNAMKTSLATLRTRGKHE
jgi:hypothetical protein